MRFWPGRLANPLLLAAAMAWLLLASTATAQDSTATKLELYLPTGSAVGQEMTVQARLTDIAGAAVVGAEVVFQRDVIFQNTSGKLELGQAITDEQGWAALPFLPRSEGQMVITAQFGGNNLYGPASASDTASIETGPQLYVEEAGVRVPGLSVALLAGLLGTVWGIYMVVMLLIWLIAREGQSYNNVGRGVS